ncbi:MAG: hypothetical protein BWK73_18730 [Thiothrix lacustris]|jgi:hypothetical protein|uniref:Uncharacterized protein n=1 Tax=Thiothrix lacustris TaxID=525917 RepID=A0A1Y1QPX1_9GAMM|nr:MAG: hypothetical protein BWK73_18730 [Thiothrix lacustris]
MTYRALTVEEERHLSQGGRVFLVGNENEVVILRKDAEPFLIGSHATGEAYKFPNEEIALQNAWVTACLSEDKPMVEGVVVGLFVDAPTRTLRT